MSASRRAAAKRRAQEAVAAQRRRERRTTVLIRSSVIAAVLAAVTAVVLVLTTSSAPVVATPRNLQSEGIVVGEGLRAVRSSAVEPGADPVPTTTEKNGSTVQIQLYADYLCPNCRAFEEENGEYIEQLVDSGAATLEVHPIAILDRVSLGSKYSTRSAAAAVCVADLAPDSFFAANKALMTAQPAEQTAGLSNDELAKVIGDVEGTSAAKSPIADCIHDQRFAPWVGEATKRALKGHFAGTDVTDFRGTPTVVVDGKQWTGGVPFREFVTAAVGESALDQ